MTAAGVDTWAPSWYVDPEGPAAAWFADHATIASKRGSRLLPEDAVAGYRVGWFPSGLVFAEGHPAGDGELCPAWELGERFVELEEALSGLGLALPSVDRAFSTDRVREGFAGVGRCDATVNLAMPTGAQGLAALAGIAAVARDAPGKAVPWYGSDRALETVAWYGHAGRRMLGRWYDKSLEASIGPRGSVIRGEDQRRWTKRERRAVEELTADVLRCNVQRRFYPLWKASKGVVVAGPIVIVEKLRQLREAGEIGPSEVRLLAGDLLFEAAGAVPPVGRSTVRRSRQRRRELGLHLADGVLEEVEVDVAQVLEQALETDAWDRRG